MLEYAYLIPLLPFVAFAINIFFGFKLKEKAAYRAIAAIVISAVLSCFVLYLSANGAHINISFKWLTISNYVIDLGYQIDPLTALMLFTVSVVASLIQIYSIGYMHGDIRYSRFFAYLSIFCGAMLTLVMANNLLLLYIAWELVGLSSYFLIGFWFERPAAALAAKKAFLVTRIGDVGLFIGVMLLFTYTHSFNLEHIFGNLSLVPTALLTFTAIAIFIGASGKSAQFPLHVWLPDAMEGPTPVSALIHAATMVAAGVYLVARTYPIFVAAPISLWVVAIVGTFTLIFAASIACVTNDIKRILAYSTLSQLGYMMMGLGVGGYAAGMFHLTTHAFFKALLFMGAGSVIHAVHTQDIFEMGGLWKKMPATFWTFTIGTLALVGLFPLAGFWSKDEIILEAFKFNPIIFAFALAGVFFTAFYMSRLFFVAFLGPAKRDAHESPSVMTYPLIILAVFAVFLGLVGSPLTGNFFQHFLVNGDHEVEFSTILALSSTGVIFLGIFTAWLIYYYQIISRSLLIKITYPAYVLVKNKYFIDEIYNFMIVRTTLLIASILSLIDKWIVDGLVNLAGLLGLGLAYINGFIDSFLVDGLVNLSGWITGLSARVLRYTQTGSLQNYALIIFMGLAVILVFSLR
ncbi:MAG: NADH-quinone oxidoreductase subunit L [bacterium]